jgi:hypothetical protein
VSAFRKVPYIRDMVGLSPFTDSFLLNDVSACVPNDWLIAPLEDAMVYWLVYKAGKGC